MNPSDPHAITYSAVTRLLYQILALSPGSRATLADIHVESVHASNVRPLSQDASWTAYVAVKAPTLKEV